MKKSVFKAIAVIAVSLSLASCGTQAQTSVSVESVEISESAITLAVGSTKQLTATVKPENATNKAVNWSTDVDNVTVSATGLVTAKKVGEATVTVRAVENGKSASCKVTVEEATVEPSDIYEVDQPVSPASSYVAYQAAISASGDTKSTFLDKSEPYYVGDDNKFNVKPHFTVYDKNDNEVDQDLWSYDFEFKVEVKGESGYSEAAANLYEVIDAAKADIKFKEDAVGKEFKVTVKPGHLPSEDRDNPNFSAVYQLTVVDGYNVYEAKELSYFDDRHGNEFGETHWNDVSTFVDQWDAFKEAHGLDKTLNPKSLILHKDIAITTDDIPANLLYSKEESDNSDAPHSVEGTFKDTAYPYAHIGEEKVTIYGNYFLLNYEELPLIDRFRGSNSDDRNSHTSFFRLLNGELEIRNINVTGNAPKAVAQADSKYSGGLMLVKAGNKAKSVSAYNIIGRKHYISFMSEEADPTAVAFTVEKAKLFDAYNCFFYNWGGEMLVKDSIIDNCGGPIVIQDHVGVDVDSSEPFEEKLEVSGMQFYKVHGIVSDTTFNHCSLTNYLLGEEAWFGQFVATPVVNMIKGLSDILYPNGVSYVYDTDLNPAIATALAQQSKDSLLNLIALNKSGKAEGMTNYPVSGTVRIINSGDTTDLFDYSSPDQEITTILSALYSEDEAAIDALCEKYNCASREALGAYADSLSEERNYDKDMTIRGNLRDLNDIPAPVLQRGGSYIWTDGNPGHIFSVEKYSTQGIIPVGNDDPFFTSNSEHLALYYTGMEIILGCSKLSA